MANYKKQLKKTHKKKYIKKKTRKKIFSLKGGSIHGNMCNKAGEIKYENNKYFICKKSKSLFGRKLKSSLNKEKGTRSLGKFGIKLNNKYQKCMVNPCWHKISIFNRVSKKKKKIAALKNKLSIEKELPIKILLPITEICKDNFTITVNKKNADGGETGMGIYSEGLHLMKFGPSLTPNITGIIYKKIKDELEELYGGESIENIDHKYPVFFIGGYDADITNSFDEKNLWTEGFPDDNLYWPVFNSWLNSPIFHQRVSETQPCPLELSNEILGHLCVFTTDKLIEEKDINFVEWNSSTIPPKCIESEKKKKKICARTGYDLVQKKKGVPDAYIFPPKASKYFSLKPIIHLKITNPYYYRVEREIDIAASRPYDIKSIKFKHHTNQEFREFDINAFGAHIFIDILDKSVKHYVQYKGVSTFTITDIEYNAISVRSGNPSQRFIEIVKVDSDNIDIIIKLNANDENPSIAQVKLTATPASSGPAKESLPAKTP